MYQTTFQIFFAYMDWLIVLHDNFMEKVSFHSNSKEGQCQRMFKLPHNCAYLTYPQDYAQKSFKQYMNWELPDVQLGLEKSEEPEIKLPTFTISLKYVYYHIRNESPVQVRCRIQEAWGWWAGMTQRDGMGREVGEGFRIGNMCTPVADSWWCMAKPIQYCKVK